MSTTIGELFPDAVGRRDAPLETVRPPDGTINPRFWRRVVWALAATAVALFGLEWVRGDLDGVGVLERLASGAGFAALFVYVVLRGAMQMYWRGGRREAWSEYGEARGLVTPESASLPPLRPFEVGYSRAAHGLHTGRLTGGLRVTVGATSWKTGSRKRTERRHLYFAWVTLPPQVAELFPGSSLTRVLRRIDGVDLGVPGERLRLESHQLDVECDVRVLGEADDLRWRELFDPVFVAGLIERHEVQWIQQGVHLVMCADCPEGLGPGAAPIQILDTLCLGADFVAARFVSAARGDVPDELLRPV